MQMKKTNSSDKSSKSNTSSGKKNAAANTNLNLEDFIAKSKTEISSLNYEESLKSLDSLLEDLQDDKIQVEELQRSYLLGKIYLDHCERLLRNVEQDVIELNLEDI